MLLMAARAYFRRDYARQFPVYAQRDDFDGTAAVAGVRTRKDSEGTVADAWPCGWKRTARPGEKAAWE